MGLMQWVRMPFGLVAAPATFNRLMRLVFAVHADVVSYFDDAVLHSPQWDNHMMGLRNMLMTLRQHKLTANPAKLYIAYDTIDFLGHCIAEGTVSPQPGKIHKILKLETPKTKKQIKSLVGLVSFYRTFIPSFSDLTAPLTNLLKAGCPEKVVWNSQCETSFARIQELLASYPILRLPDFTKEFVVRTDASDVGIGAVLLQAHNDKLMPCKYASRKLLPRETRYSTIEREALSVIFAVSIFSRYLRMSHFILEVDHRPLLFLK
ncbi:Pol polyprotein [Plakobranchus ocellatus]|uniref:Pol polyprotein n=1 Tax=Plakobranchus ocellatus TaxID=259542 RepID=A0AAV3ZQY0_9GAST|nr:Pol polyprotein [Plakobranchus ocellatus]